MGKMNKIITMKDLVKTKYKGKHCIGFEYHLEDNGLSYNFIFEKAQAEFDSSAWKLYCLLPDIYSDGNNKKMVQFVYGLPKDDLSLVKIAAIGLQLVRGLMQREINLCTTIDFLINEHIEGLR